MTHRRHVRIVGSGAVGLCLAWELSRRGLEVTLMDRAQIGRGTSWAGAGILPAANYGAATDPIDRLRGLSHDLFPQWTETLESITGIDSGYRRCGGWYLASTAGERAAMVGMTGYWNELGIECASVPSDALVSREPSLRSWSRRPRGAAWWVPGEAQVRPPRFLRALAEACRIAGVRLVEQTPITDIRSNDSTAEVLDGNHRRHSADCVVICSGAWTGQIAKSLRLQCSLVPVRGQMLLLKTDTPRLRSIVNVGHRYVVCRDDGHTLVGSNEEETGFELGTSNEVLDSLHQFAARLVPELESAPRIDAWSGLRPMTFDGFPMIGRVPDTRNLFVAAGHFRSGIHLAPATATVLADLICGQSPPIDLDAFSVGRQQSSASMFREAASEPVGRVNG